MATIRILGIESSCDDTAAAVIEDGRVLSNAIASQTDHEIYGGVVPEIASRAHQVHIVAVVERALRDAGVERDQLTAIAVTRGPGLLGSLLVGVNFAKGLALSLGIPIVEVHHMHAHIMAHFAEPPYPAFPFLCLTVSGGHTQIVEMRSHLDFTVLGKTLDDAAGEAFDKTGKLLGLPYPAGPHIDRLAAEGNAVFPFPIPQIPGLDFSFSGLKTSILYFLREKDAADPSFRTTSLADICASVQHTIVQILMEKLASAVAQTGITEVAIAGGVSANSGLRKALEEWSVEKGWNHYIPAFEYCTDNAAMIGLTGYYKYLADKTSNLKLTPSPKA
jgi:N6-L-threonylcarbamoyladenine synthase